jgi:hypothetical protein
MPRIRPCQNHADCKGFALDGEKLCQYCREIQKETENKWRHAGWTRVDERQQLQGKKGRK